MKRQVLIAACTALLVALAFGMAGTRNVLRVIDEKAVTFDQMLGEVKRADVILVGEVHTSRKHHRLQLDVISALHEADEPLIIGVEMFRAESQRALDAWVAGSLSLDQFLSVYYENWSMPWPLYEDIFTYAREHRIPLAGLNIPEKIAKAIARKGFTALSEAQRKQLPPGIGCTVDPAYMEFIRKAYADHAQGSGRQFVHFCEAQMVWDKSMAWHLVEFMKKNPGRTAVVLAGMGHAWRGGIPEQVAQQSKYTSRVILHLVPSGPDRSGVTIQDADYVVLR
jgi:uncharacterized iron-regulated protein